jgi:hypothetical protein
VTWHMPWHMMWCVTRRVTWNRWRSKKRRPFPTGRWGVASEGKQGQALCDLCWFVVLSVHVLLVHVVVCVVSVVVGLRVRFSVVEYETSTAIAPLRVR